MADPTDRADESSAFCYISCPHCRSDCCRMSAIIAAGQRHFHYHCASCHRVWMHREPVIDDIRGYRPPMAK